MLVRFVKLIEEVGEAAQDVAGFVDVAELLTYERAGANLELFAGSRRGADHRRLRSTGLGALGGPVLEGLGPGREGVGGPEDDVDERGEVEAGALMVGGVESPIRRRSEPPAERNP